MADIALTVAFGVYQPGGWISRYCRLRADLPAGRHRLVGEVHNPEGEDLAGNTLSIGLNLSPIGAVEQLEPGESRAFSFDLPVLEAPESVAITLRASRFRIPPPPDERLLGLIVLALKIENVCAQADETQGEDCR